MKMDEYCSKHFRYKDILYCSSTQKETQVKNIPEQAATLVDICLLARSILDPLHEQFGSLELTYGFCSQLLSKHIKSRISPKLDQHAGSELNSAGNRICERGGMAVDFIVRGLSSLVVAKWIISNLDFDRLYFYGEDKPLHISANSYQPKKQIVLMLEKNDRRVPKTISMDKFYSL